MPTLLIAGIDARERTRYALRKAGFADDFPLPDDPRALVRCRRDGDSIADAVWVSNDEELWDTLRHNPIDGYIARLDRNVSIAISRSLIRTAVTPNMMTTASMLIGIAGALMLVSTSYSICVGGALLGWFSAILDGCDGEIARVKLLSSEWGAKYDLWADHIVNVLTFIAIPIHVYRVAPHLPLLVPGIGLVFGVLMSMLVIWWVLLRAPSERWDAAEKFIGRIASRDFVYVVLLLAALRHLEWFVYLAAFGANAFWIGVCIFRVAGASSPRPASTGGPAGSRRHTGEP